jgi:hypothetical protein
VGLAIVGKGSIDAGAPVALINPPRGASEAAVSGTLRVGSRVTSPIAGTILPRFMTRGMLPPSGEE